MKNAIVRLSTFHVIERLLIHDLAERHVAREQQHGDRATCPSRSRTRSSARSSGGRRAASTCCWTTSRRARCRRRPASVMARMKRKPIGRSARAPCRSAPRRVASGARERNHRPGHHRRDERERRRQDEERHVRRRRIRLFLHDVLHAVGERLQQPVRPDAIRAVTVLDPRRDLPLGERQQRDADHVHREDDDHLHDRGDEEDGRSPACLRVGDAAASRRLDQSIMRSPPPTRPAIIAPRSPSRVVGRVRRTRACAAASAANVWPAVQKPEPLPRRGEQVGQHEPARPRHAGRRLAPAGIAARDRGGS